ncbi:hypothetical protein ACQKWADRAFT_305224 [Trichoderma austrokoningii]
MASTTTRFTMPRVAPRPATSHHTFERSLLLSSRPTAYDPRAIVRVLIPISIAGWLLFGVICILCINGRGKLGRWIPEWYLDSEGTRCDKAMVGLWWVAVIVFWPVILPVLFVRKVVCFLRRLVRGGREAQMLWPRGEEV